MRALVIVYIFILFVYVPLDSQVFTPLDSLFLSADTLYSLKREAFLLEFHQTNKYKALNYLPSIGYDFFNHSPVLTYNISALSGFLNNRQSQRWKQQAVEKKVLLELDQAKKIITTHYLHLLDLFSAYSIELEIYKLNLKLYNLNLCKYTNNEIPLEVFIEKQIQIKEKERSLYSMKDQIFHTIITLENLTNYHLYYEIEDFVSVSSTCIP
jgi:hypothetical protein